MVLAKSPSGEKPFYLLCDWVASKPDLTARCEECLEATGDKKGMQLVYDFAAKVSFSLRFNCKNPAQNAPVYDLNANDSRRGSWKRATHAQGSATGVVASTCGPRMGASTREVHPRALARARATGGP